MRRFSLPVAVAVLLLPVLPLQAGGVVEPLTVVLTYPDAEFRVGDTVTAQAHVFRDGARFDPDEVIFTAGVDYDVYPMTRVDRGLWEATVVITRDRIYHHDRFPIEVKVTADTPEHEWDFDSHLVFVSGMPYLSVGIYLDDEGDRLPSPGEEVEFTVTVSHGDGFADPDNLRVWVTSDADDATEDLVVERSSAGVYHGTYFVPSAIASDIHLRLRVQANITDDLGTESDSAVTDLHSRLYSTWVHLSDVNDSVVASEVHFLDPGGDPVAGAAVTLNLTYQDDGDRQVSDVHCLTTGPDGVVLVNVPIGSVGQLHPGVFVSGEVSKGGYVQRIGFWVINPRYVYDPVQRTDGFRVRLLNDRPLPPGSLVDLEFQATFDGIPLVGTAVASYLYWDHSILFNGTVTTDGEGVLVIEAFTPDNVQEGWWRDWIRGRFKASTPAGFNSSWGSHEFSHFASWWDYYSTTHPDITMDLVRTGEETYRFALKAAGLDGEGEAVVVSWGLGPYEDGYGTSPTWMLGDRYTSSYLEAGWSGDAWVGTLRLPPFLPADCTFNLAARFTHVDVPGSEWGYARVLNSSSYLANEPPIVDIEAPGPGDEVEGAFEARGTASDDGAVEVVEVRVDGGPWSAATGTDGWALEVPGLGEGTHTVEARAFDGTRWSEVDSVEFSCVRAEHDVDGATPWAVIVLAAILVGIVVVLVLRARAQD